MPDIWNLPFFRCLSRLSATFREQLVEDLESGRLRRMSRTLEQLRKTHESNRRECLSYRLVDRRWLLPLSAMLEVMESASDHIAEHGLLRGCRKEFDRFGFQVETEATDEARRLLTSGKSILYVGNHPCIWGPDLWAFATALDKDYPERDDFVVLTWTLVMGLCPALGPYSAPVVVTARDIERFTHDENRTGDDRKMGFESLFQRWTPDIPVAQTRRCNYEALQDMARRWLDGGDVFIFPTGGAGTKAMWFSGVGQIVRFAAETLDGARGPDPHILFFQVKGASDFQLFGPPFLSRWHPASLVGWFFPRRIKISFRDTFRLRDWHDRFREMPSRSIARWLQKEFESATSEGRRADPQKAQAS